MEQKIITKINGIEIVTVNQDGGTFVPIKPICTAIGIDFAAQYNKIQSDEFLQPVIAIIATTGADGKTYDMVCLPLKYVYGWLATINPGKVAPDARETVTQYRRQCYDILYEHFTCSMKRTIETNNAEIELLRQINSAISDEKEARDRRKKAEKDLDKLRAARLDPQPSLFD